MQVSVGVWGRSTVRYKLFTDAESASHSAPSLCVICTSHVAQPLTSPHLIPPRLSLSLEDTRVCVCVCACVRACVRACVCVCWQRRSVCCSSVCETGEEAHRDRQMLKDKDVQLRSINCKAGEGAMLWHRPTSSYTHTHFCTTLGVNFIPIRVHVFLSEVFVLPPPWVSASVCVCVYVHASILNLNPDRYMHNVNHARIVIAYVCSYTCCIKVMPMLDFVRMCLYMCVFIYSTSCVCICVCVCGEVWQLEQTVARVTRERMRLWRRVEGRCSKWGQHE